MNPKVKISIYLLLIASLVLNIILLKITYDSRVHPNKQKINIQNYHKNIFIPKRDYLYMRSIGKENAPIKLVMFTDYECYYCHQFFQETFPLINKNFIEKGVVQFYIKNFPSKSHYEGFKMALLLSSIKNDSAFWKYHLEIMQSNTQLDSSCIHKIAKSENINNIDLNKIFRDSLLLNKLNKEITFANNNGVYGIPAFSINGKLFIGNRNANDFITLIEKTLIEKEEN